jgi:hypothetical protein
VWQRDLSVSHNKMGDAMETQGKLAEALSNYRASFAIIERLAKADPSNAGWLRDLSVSHEKMGGVLRTQGKWAEALDGYRASLAIRERLAKVDPSNSVWQSDLSGAHKIIGDMIRAQGELKAVQEFLLRHASGEPGLDFFPSLQKLSEVKHGQLSRCARHQRATGKRRSGQFELAA